MAPAMTRLHLPVFVLAPHGQLPSGDLDWPALVAALAPKGRLHQLGVPPQPIEEILNQVAAFGYNVVDTAPEFPASEVVVRGVNVAYLGDPGAGLAL